LIKKLKFHLLKNGYRGMDGEPGMSQPPLENETVFQKKQRKGTIDIWWLYDDGGFLIEIACN